MPDDQDYTDLGRLLAQPEHWTAGEVRMARMIRRSQAEAAAAFDQRDQERVGAMWAVVQQIDEALERWERSR